MAVILATLIVLLFAALPTWPYSASGRARYRRSQISPTSSLIMDVILVLFLIGLLIAALPPRSYKISSVAGADFPLSGLPSLPDLQLDDRRPTLGLWNEGAVPTLFAMTEALPTV